MTISVKIGDGFCFDENKISTSWKDDTVDDENIKQNDGLYLPDLKGKPGESGTGSSVDDYTIKEVSEEDSGGNNRAFKSLSEVCDAMLQGNPQSEGDVITLTYRDGQTESDFTVNIYRFISKAITRMGYRFGYGDTHNYELLSHQILDHVIDNNITEFIYDTDGVLSNRWKIIDYDVNNLQSGDILIASPESYVIPEVTPYRHLAVFVANIDGVLHGYDVTSSAKLQSTIHRAKDVLDQVDYIGAMKNDSDSIITNKVYEKILRFENNIKLIDIDSSKIVKIYSLAAWTTDPNDREIGRIAYTNPKHAKKKSDVINAINFLMDERMVAYKIEPKNLLQFVVIDNDNNTDFTHTLYKGTNPGTKVAEDMNRYPDEKVVALFAINSVTYRTDYPNAIADIELYCLWSHNNNWWTPGTILGD